MVLDYFCYETDYILKRKTLTSVTKLRIATQPRMSRGSWCVLNQNQNQNTGQNSVLTTVSFPAQLQQNPALQQQLQNLDYNLFEKLTCIMQNLVAPPGQAACPDGLVQKQRIAWAFEVTSRLSSVTVVHRRAIQNFGARYIAENHAGWVQQQGGWVRGVTFPNSNIVFFLQNGFFCELVSPLFFLLI
uniref:Uncharacterized protein n=1 Tax=Xiphophorus maculatus TaxID=8083 RepID=A0A3B5QCP3_XIPMA